MVTNTDATTQDTHSTQNNYYQPTSGLVLPQPDPYSTSSQAMGTSVSQRGNYSHNLPEVTQPMVHPAPPIPAPAGTIAPAETRRWTAFGSGSVNGSSTSKTRRSLPSEPSHPNTQNIPANPQPSDWAQTSNATMPATTMASVSPQMTYETRSSGRTRQKNQSLTNDASQQATAVANTVIQQAQARQSPAAAAAMTAQVRKSPYQQPAVPRTTSRTSQRNQSRTPVSEQARGYQPSSDMDQQQNPRGSTHYDTSHMSSGSGYNDYGRYSGTSTGASHQPPTTMSTSYQTTSSTANQWSNSSSRNDRSYDTNPSYQTPNIHVQTTASKPAASRQNFNMRANTQQHTRASSGSYNQQKQQQGYPSYSGSTHQNQQGQASNQQQPSSWYFQNSHNPSINPGGQSSGYNYETWSGV
jgi:hypothetical protein